MQSVKESLKALAKRCAEWVAKVRQRLKPSESQPKQPSQNEQEKS
jgi:hypothetical protein